jgi:hypothetical protein
MNQGLVEQLKPSEIYWQYHKAWLNMNISNTPIFLPARSAPAAALAHCSKPYLNQAAGQTMIGLLILQSSTESTQHLAAVTVAQQHQWDACPKEVTLQRYRSPLV